MATISATQSPTASSPVRLPSRDNTTPSLRPAPLRVPDRKNRNACNDHESHKGDNREGQTDPAISAARKTCATSPRQLAWTEPSSQRRFTTSKFGSLVSKFEILDAVNNADTEASHLLRASSTRAAVQRGSKLGATRGQPLASRRVMPQSNSSIEKSSKMAESSEVSPRQIDSPNMSSGPPPLPTSIPLETSTAYASSVAEMPRTVPFPCYEWTQSAKPRPDALSRQSGRIVPLNVRGPHHSRSLASSVNRLPG